MTRDELTVDGRVVESFRSDTHAIDVEVGGHVHRVMARRCGRMVLNHIKVLPGDRVTVQLSPYDLTRGRIVERLDRARAA